MKTGTRGEASVRVAAAPEKVYELVSDVTRMGEWSPETTSAEWIDGATGPAVGARFKGRNRNGVARWSTTPAWWRPIRGGSSPSSPPGCART